MEVLEEEKSNKVGNHLVQVPIVLEGPSNKDIKNNLLKDKKKQLDDHTTSSSRNEASSEDPPPPFNPPKDCHLVMETSGNSERFIDLSQKQGYE